MASADADETLSDVVNDNKNIANETHNLLDLWDDEINNSVDIKLNNQHHLLEQANNFSITSGKELNKVFVDGGKKFRIMKVVKEYSKDELRDEDALRRGLRNIKLKVDSNGKKRVPNLFKVKKRIYDPSKVRRKNRQIYRGEYDKYKEKIEREKKLKSNKEETSASTPKEVSVVDAKVKGIPLTPNSLSSNIKTDNDKDQSTAFSSNKVHVVSPISNPLLPHNSPLPILKHQQYEDLPASQYYGSTTPLPKHGPTHGYSYATRHSYVNVQFGEDKSYPFSEHLQHEAAGDIVTNQSTIRSTLLPQTVVQQKSDKSLPAYPPSLPSYEPTIHQSSVALPSTSTKPPFQQPTFPSLKEQIPFLQPSSISQFADHPGSSILQYNPSVYSPEPSQGLSAKHPIETNIKNDVHSSAYFGEADFDQNSYPLPYEAQNVVVTTYRPSYSRIPITSQDHIPSHYILPSIHHQQPEQHSLVEGFYNPESYLNPLPLKEFNKTSVLELQNKEKKINLIGPIKVKVIGPNTFSIVHSGNSIKDEMEKDSKKTKNGKRENTIGNFYKTTTKRPSIHFEPEEESETDKTHYTNIYGENLSFRHSTTARPLNSVSHSSKQDEPSYILPHNIGQRKPKYNQSVRFADEALPSLRVRFEEVKILKSIVCMYAIYFSILDKKYREPSKKSSFSRGLKLKIT